MSARSALLRAFAWLLLGAMLVMTALSFFAFRHAMQVEIARNLEFSASVIKERIDTLIHTQVQNMQVWRTLQVMQDITVGDVDKRLSGSLLELRVGQKSLYKVLFCTNDVGRVVSASDRSMIGATMPVAGGWQAISSPASADVFVAPMDPDHRQAIALRTEIPNAFGQGTIGHLYVVLDFGAFQNVLDQAVEEGPRNLLILDSRGYVIGASRELRERLDISALRLEDWKMPKAGATSYVHAGRALGEGELLVGAAASSQYQHLEGMGWRILMIESTGIAFRPVLNLLWGLLALLLFTMTIGVWIASRLAGSIAQPIVELTAFTRRFRQGDKSLPEPPGTTVSEVTELFGAYAEMIRALESSREQIVRAGKLAVVGEMAAIMAHEIRTPLSIVRSSAQLLERQPDLNAIVHNVLDLIATRVEAARVSVVLDLEPNPAAFDCDKEQMMQVFLNLLLNALQFVPEGGKLGIRIFHDAGALCVSVEDDGPGVAPSIREHVFDPFFSRREGGIGLGLTVVQQIVQAHGGDIAVGVSGWGGAAFNMRFPLKSGAGRS